MSSFAGYAKDFASFKRKNTFQTGGSSAKQMKPGPLIEISDTQQLGKHQSPKFHREERRYLVRLKHNLKDYTNVFNAKDKVSEDIRRIISVLTTDVPDNNFVTFYINHRELNQPLFIPPFRKKNFTSESFLNAIATVSQSNKGFLLDGQLEMTIGIVTDIVGGARSHPI